LEAIETPIVGFEREATYPLGTKMLPIRVGDKGSSRTIEANF